MNFFIQKKTEIWLYFIKSTYHMESVISHWKFYLCYWSLYYISSLKFKDPQILLLEIFLSCGETFLCLDFNIIYFHLHLSVTGFLILSWVELSLEESRTFVASLHLSQLCLYFKWKMPFSYKMPALLVGSWQCATSSPWDLKRLTIWRHGSLNGGTDRMGFDS